MPNHILITSSCCAVESVIVDGDSNEDHGEKRWRLSDAAPAAVSAVATTAALVAGAPPESGALIGLGASQLASAIQPSVERRFRRFMGQLLRPWEHVDDPADRFWRHVQEREAAQEAVLAGLARLRDLLDPTVAASLGKLVQAYVAAERLPDRFFRDASGVLIDLAPGELLELHRLLDFLSRTQVYRVRVTVALGGGEIGINQVEGTAEGILMQSLDHERFAATQQTVHLMRLLARHGIGSEASGDSRLAFDFDVDGAGRLLDALVLDVEAAGAAGESRC